MESGTNRNEITASATSVVAFVALVALYGILDAKRTRHAQIILDFSRRWDEPDVNESFRAYRRLGADGVLELVRKVYPLPRGTVSTATADELDEYLKVVVQANVIESAAVLMSEKAISAKAIYKMWGATVTSARDAWRPSIEHLRQYEGHGGAFRYFEELAGKVEKYAKRERAAATEIRPADA